MKTTVKKILLGSSFVLILLVLSLVLIIRAAVCNPELAAILDIPQNVVLDEREILSWSAVENADAYVVTVNDEEYRTAETSLDLFELLLTPDDYEITVYAYCNGKDIEPSDISDIIKYVVPNPVGLEFTGTSDGSGYIMRAGDKDKLSGKVIVPAEINGKPVTQIISNGFSGCENITSVFIPDTVTDIGNYAFKDDISLVRCRLPAGLKKIPLGTFFGCTSLPEADIPEHVEELGGSVFYGCENLKTIHIPKALEKFKRNNFIKCKNIETITVAEGNAKFKAEENCLILIEDDSVFLGNKLGALPSSATSIGEGAFSSINITSITIPARIKKIGNGAFQDCELLTTVVMEDGIEDIGMLAFERCSALTDINLPNTIEVIMAHTFSKCASLNYIIIPEGIKEIENGAFSGCGFEEIKLPESLEIIGAGIFGGCDFLKKLEIPKNVKSMGYDNLISADAPIGYCKNMVELTVDKDNPYFYSQNNCIIEKSSATVLQCITGSVISEGVKKIGPGAFSSNTDIVEISIPYGVEEIGKYCFNFCLNLQKVYLPEGLKIIGEKAFFRCVNLESVALPASVSTIETGAFYEGTIFLSESECPEGFYKGSENVPSWNSNIAVVLTNFNYVYDGNHPYAESFIKQGRERLCNVPTRNGYTFLGWSLSKDSDEIVLGVTVKEAHWYEPDFSNPNQRYWMTEKRKMFDNVSGEPNVKDYPDGTVFYAVWQKN